MKIFYQKLLIALLVLSINPHDNWAQNTVGLLTYDSAKVAPGYNLVFPHNQSTVHLLDNCGRTVHQWPDDANWRPGNSVYLTEKGNLIKCKRENVSNMDPIWAGGGGAIVEVLNWENELLASFEQNDSLYRLHHDIAPLPNGNILMIVWEYHSEDAAIQAGRDASTLAQNKLWSEVIWEWDPVLDSIVWEWRVWDHLIQDHDASKDNFGDVGIHPERIDINYDEHDGHPDWLHMNALGYNPVLDQIIMSVPYFNEVWIVDHSTTTEEAASTTGGLSGKGGDLLYRYGNPATYRQGTIADKKLAFQHDCKWVNPTAMPGDDDFGLLSVFNNRIAENTSPMVIWNPRNEDQTDYLLEEGSFGPEGFTREIFHPDSLSIGVSTGLSSAEVLPNGNVLILSGRWGFAYEITPDNQVVWEYRIPLKGGSPVDQGTELAVNNNITFRMSRYAPDHPAFVGKDLNPGAFWELNPNPETCTSTVVDVDSAIPSQELIEVFPNPTRDILNIRMPRRSMVQLFDARGQRMAAWEFGTGNHQINLSAYPRGFYFLKAKGEAIRLIRY